MQSNSTPNNSNNDNTANAARTMKGAFPPPASPASKLTLEKLERLAVARLQHTVNELQSQVDLDRTLCPPSRKLFHCVCDDTALTASISDLKRFVADKSIRMIVPFAGKHLSCSAVRAR